VVDAPAVPPDLAPPARAHPDSAHLPDRARELVEEVAPPAREAVHHPGGAAVREQRGVGREQPPPQLQVHVVVRVEPRRAAGVHGHRRRAVRGRRRPARRAELRRVRRVQRRVRRGGGGGIAEARREGVAVADADRVRACDWIGC
jgi:hypothetical protein